MAIALFFCGAVWGADEIDFLERGNFAGTPSSDGAVTLSWSSPEQSEDSEAVVEVQQADTADFANAVQRYRGSDRATVLTGLAEGEHWFRIRRIDAAQSETVSNWSAPLKVTVQFFPRGRLFAFLIAGAVVVLATIGTIVGGSITAAGDGEGGKR